MLLLKDDDDTGRLEPTLLPPRLKLLCEDPELFCGDGAMKPPRPGPPFESFFLPV